MYLDRLDPYTTASQLEPGEATKTLAEVGEVVLLLAQSGMTNGQPVSVRAAIKPISSLTKPLRSVDTETKQPAQALRERTDSTVVPAAAIVGEAMVALTLARAYREKFGGDHIDDVVAAVEAYKQRIDFRG